ncbi:MAG: CBS domain-containing protein, partial [Candidatus Micrarchaeota archaeon]|nr:CBS domain-containing protein [Candidatus Micrarchaeota archaeon]
VLHLLAQLQQKYNLSYLFISHDLAVMRAMAHRVIVFKDGAYYGIVDDRSMAVRGNTKIPQNYPVGKFAKRVPILTRSMDIRHAIQAFYESSSKAVPFAENDKIKGILRRTDILKSILSLHILASYKASDIMSTPVIGIDQEATLEKAKNAMKENNVNRLIVLDKGKLFGIITYKNIIESTMAVKNRSPEFSPKGRIHTRVAEFSHRDINTIDDSVGIDQAIREMVKNGVSSLLVTRKGHPVGMLTVRDILETIIKDSNVQKKNIVISGMDSDLREYQDEIEEELDAFANRVDKFRDVKVDYIAVNIKKIKSRQYEIKARLGLLHGGAVSMNASGFSLQSTLKQLTDKLYKTIEVRNDIVITNRKL